MGYDTIHETSIVDIALAIKDGIKIAKDSNSKVSNLKYSSSIAKSSKGLIMEFPVLVSKANHIESAATVAKAYEAKFVTMLQLVFSASNITNSKDGYEFIKGYHNNLDQKLLTVDEFIDVMDRYVIKEGTNISSESYAMYKAVTEDMKNLSFYFEDDINESSLESYKVIKNYDNIRVVKEQTKTPMDDLDNNVDSESRSNETEWKGKKPNDNKDDGDGIDPELKLKMNKDERDKHKEKRDADKHNVDMFTKFIVPQDIKKANELTPTMMIVNFKYRESEKSEVVTSQFIVGVKAKLYEVEPTDVISKIITKHVDSNVLLKLIKVSTREISFVKDFLLAIDDAKLYALSKSKRGSTNKLFKVLERRALGGKIRKALKLQNYTQAISSLVISQEEAEELLKNNIDVSNPSVIRPIMEKLNLISFAIIDESSESVKFIFDTGDDIYETIPFSKLERDQRDGMSKKVINLMAKMAR